jgi:hypothetical protein
LPLLEHVSVPQPVSMGLSSVLHMMSVPNGHIPEKQLAADGPVPLPTMQQVSPLPQSSFLVHVNRWPEQLAVAPTHVEVVCVTQQFCPS